MPAAIPQPVVLLFPPLEERLRRARVRAEHAYDRALHGGHRSNTAARRALRAVDATFPFDGPEAA
jgi:hypothetical protein